MLLSELFEQLSHGELSNLSIGNSNGSGILPKDYPSIIAHINLGLTALHKIFPLKMVEAIIQEYNQINIYFLDKKYAVNGGSSEPIKYLIDTTTNPFINNIFKVERVYNELGKEIPLNNSNDLTSIFTPTYNSIQIPNPVNTNTISVICRANHNIINPITVNPSIEEIKIPASLLEPLLFYVASRAYASVPMIDGVNQSAGYLNKFEASIQRVKNLDLVNDAQRTNQKLWNNRWP